jgi:hypothetical protein
MPMAGPTVKAPPPFVFTQKDAKQTLLIGCSVPFEGQQQLVGQAVLSALKMAVTDIVPVELPGFNVNITCINSKCEDIPAYMAVSKFAAEGASEWCCCCQYVHPTWLTMQGQKHWPLDQELLLFPAS